MRLPLGLLSHTFKTTKGPQRLDVASVINLEYLNTGYFGNNHTISFKIIEKPIQRFNWFYFTHPLYQNLYDTEMTDSLSMPYRSQEDAEKDITAFLEKHNYLKHSFTDYRSNFLHRLPYHMHNHDGYDNQDELS